jgi:hypothetical protein
MSRVIGSTSEKAAGPKNGSSAQDLLGAVGRRGEPVAGQHAQRQRPGQPLVLELLGDQGQAERPALDRIPKSLRQLSWLAARHRGRRPRRPGRLHVHRRHLVLLLLVAT